MRYMIIMLYSVYNISHINTKSGTALLLLRYLRLWYCLNIRTATPKPTPICTYARVPIINRYERYGYTYPEDIKMLQCA